LNNKTRQNKWIDRTLVLISEFHNFSTRHLVTEKVLPACTNCVVKKQVMSELCDA